MTQHFSSENEGRQYMDALEASGQPVPTNPAPALGTFADDLQALLNRHSMENGSNTPDFMLATYLQDCLDTFNRVVNRRETWYGRTTP